MQQDQGVTISQLIEDTGLSYHGVYKIGTCCRIEHEKIDCKMGTMNVNRCTYVN